MRDVTEATATEAVLRTFAATSDGRLRQVMTSLVTHLHAFVREVEPTEAEWAAAIRFLTETGHMCDDRRQEFILLSDTLGVSTLVELINNRRQPGTTGTSVLGPFFVEHAPPPSDGVSLLRDGTRPTLRVHGRVAAPDGAPVAGAVMDMWQTAPNGLYDVQDPAQPAGNMRARLHTRADGGFDVLTVRPTPYTIPHDGPVGKLLAAAGRHPWRPSHLHVMIDAPGFRRLTTALYFDGDQHLDSDAVFGVKEALVVRPVPAAGGIDEVRFDFTLERAAA